ncbi:MAG: hypothetical protein HRT44_06890 [Bdellovibrionales bacterium]|nr:hypothetical protein [Bdellovibrionales bacterium]
MGKLKLTPKQHRRLVNKAFKRSQELYREFTWDWQDDKIVLQLPVLWPPVGMQAEIGKATAIGYHSDKAKAGVHTDYIHQHIHPYPTLVKRWFKGEGLARLSVEDSYPEPTPLVTTFLGFCLDWEFQPVGTRKKSDRMHLNWKRLEELPLLCWHAESRSLIVVPLDGGDVLVASSSHLTVTERGIEN